MRKLLIILGVPIDDLTMEEALCRLESFIVAGRAAGKGHQIATVNADFLIKAKQDPLLRKILRRADMATADGMPLVWGARRLGVPLKERVTGSDLTPAIAKMAAEKGYTLFFLGAAPGVADQAATVLQRQYPDLQIVGTLSPPFVPIDEMDAGIIDEIKAVDPDILLVAFGNPKQEKWIFRHAKELNVPVMMGIGASLDFIAGASRRAPQWLQRLGLEWLHRLAQEPHRMWKRYANDFVGFGYFFAKQWWIMRKGNNTEVTLPDTPFAIVDHTALIQWQGNLDVYNYRPLIEQANNALEMTPYLIINLSRVEFMDSSVIGSLIGLTKQARDADGELWLADIPPQIQEVFAMLNLEEFFKICHDVGEARAQAAPFASSISAAVSARRFDLQPVN